MTDAQDRLFCAIDTPDLDRARDLARRLKGIVGGLKLGLEFFSAHGPEGVRHVMADMGRPAGAGAGPAGSDPAPLFLDLKFHDIPNTVAAAIRATVPLAPRILNVHAQGGPAMMRAAAEAARDAAREAGVPRPLIVAVTILTSLDPDDLLALGHDGTIGSQVLRLARMARDSGLDGVVCSAHEIALLRRELGPDFTLITPGLRPAGSATDDQKRVKTPAEALAEGADYLVVGRPITAASDPGEAARALVAGLSEGHRSS